MGFERLTEQPNKLQLLYDIEIQQSKNSVNVELSIFSFLADLLIVYQQVAYDIIAVESCFLRTIVHLVLVTPLHLSHLKINKNKNNISNVFGVIHYALIRIYNEIILYKGKF